MGYKYLNLYKKWKQTGRMPDEGLCRCIDYTQLELFYPTKEDKNWLREKGWPVVYWGYGKLKSEIYSYYWRQEFTPLRENVILLLAAMNNEL